MYSVIFFFILFLMSFRQTNRPVSSVSQYYTMFYILLRFVVYYLIQFTKYVPQMDFRLVHVYLKNN